MGARVRTLVKASWELLVGTIDSGEGSLSGYNTGLQRVGGRREREKRHYTVWALPRYVSCSYSLLLSSYPLVRLLRGKERKRLGNWVG